MFVGSNEIYAAEPPYSKSRFNGIKREVVSHVRKIGYQPKAVAFGPLSGLQGDNMIKPSDDMKAVSYTHLTLPTKRIV